MMQPREPVKAAKIHQPCPDCDSHDALTINQDGSTKCYACDKFTPPPKEEPLAAPPRAASVRPKVTAAFKSEKPAEFLEVATYPELTERKLRSSVLKKYNYGTGRSRLGTMVHIANYYKAGKPVAQHIRGPEKSFAWIGDTSKLELFGQGICKGRGPMLAITEGELDALSVSQTVPEIDVVSLPNGCSSVDKYLGQNLEFVEGYASVVLMFDGDEPGQQATRKALDLLSPGKARLVTWPGGIKDASDMLQANRATELRKLVYAAQPWRPDGVVAASSISLEDLRTPLAQGARYPFPKLQLKTAGARKGEITLWTAGSGIGKSTLTRQLAYLYRKQGLRCGMIYLEESNKKTALGFIALDNNVPLFKLRSDPNCIPEDKFIASYNELIVPDGLFLYDHFGSLDSKNLLNKIRHMALVEEIDYLFLDHISIVVSGSESDNERKDIDILMTHLRSMVEETGLGVQAVSHLKRTNGKSFNDGDPVQLSDLRGSAALEQLSDNVFALERNQQAEGDMRNRSQIRVLKCRETGDTGLADKLEYNPETGWLTPTGGYSNDLPHPFTKEETNEQEQDKQDE